MEEEVPLSEQSVADQEAFLGQFIYDLVSKQRDEDKNVEQIVVSNLWNLYGGD